jgi:glycosyltransferase involved in cell wall biosynthesis
MRNTNLVWLVVDSRVNGGIESHILELARALAQRKLTVSVVFLRDYGPHPLRDALRRAGIHTESLDGHLDSLVGRIRQESPGVLHSHGYKAGLYCFCAAKITGSFHCSTFHAGEISPGKVGIYDWLHRQASRFIDSKLAVSQLIARRVPAEITVLDNFVSLPPIQRKTGQRIAFVGRLSHEKGPDMLLDLASRIPEQDFHIYGDGPLADSLRRKAPRSCVFHGNQDSMEPHWQDIDLLLMPSRYEGLPMVALEAMARRIPVIAFEVGALDRVVHTNRNGWLVPPGRLDLFQSRIEAWLNMSPQSKQAIRASARQHVQKHFSADRVLPELLKHYAIDPEERLACCNANCD